MNRFQLVFTLLLKDRDEYFQQNSVPIVQGPDGKVYMIDHHHFTMAAAEAGYDQVYVNCLDT
ncbi:MAG: hypothetical protein B7Y39_07985 [Bdellovibrio sp. 28-41-41]|nr:MAG: hypothetical protein B7Y39_07985 [Bdellovibrio sp. 28-41-41]